MGTYRSVFVGVFIAAPHFKSETKRKVFRKPSGKVSQTRFNPETGEEYKEDVIVEKVWQEPVPYITDNDNLKEDMFFMPAYTGSYNGERMNYFLPGSSSGFGETHSGIATVVFDDYESPEQSIGAFIDKYKAYLDYYKKKYPEVEFEVKYGVVVYEH